MQLEWVEVASLRGWALRAVWRGRRASRIGRGRRRCREVEVGPVAWRGRHYTHDLSVQIIDIIDIKAQPHLMSLHNVTKATFGQPPPTQSEK